MSTTPSGRGWDRHDQPRGIPTRVLPLLAGALLVLLAVAPVMAHADLEASRPKDGAVLDVAPTEVVLGFSEALSARSGFKLIGPDGSTIGEGTIADDPTRLALRGLSLAPGAYTVEWTSVADDGDVLRGKLTFTVAAPTPPPATPTPAPTDVPGSETPSAAPSVAPTASLAPTPSPSAEPVPAAGSGSDALIPIVAGLALVAILGGLFFRRRGAA